MKPVFYEPDKWKMDHVYLDKAGEYLPDQSDLQGNFHIKIGEYAGHELYINGEVFIENNHREKEVYLQPFPEGNYIFDTEPVLNHALWEEEYQPMLDEMWKENEPECNRAYKSIESWFSENTDKFIDQFMDMLRTTRPEEYSAYQNVKLSRYCSYDREQINAFLDKVSAADIKQQYSDLDHNPEVIIEIPENIAVMLLDENKLYPFPDYLPVCLRLEWDIDDKESPFSMEFIEYNGGNTLDYEFERNIVNSLSDMFKTVVEREEPEEERE